MESIFAIAWLGAAIAVFVIALTWTSNAVSFVGHSLTRAPS